MEPIKGDITVDQLEQFIQRYGRRASHTMSVLGKYDPFVQAIQTEVGQQILQDDISRHEYLLNKVYDEQANESEMAEFRYLKRRLRTVAERISLWMEAMKSVKNN